MRIFYIDGEITSKPVEKFNEIAGASSKVSKKVYIDARYGYKLSIATADDYAKKDCEVSVITNCHYLLSSRYTWNEKKQMHEAWIYTGNIDNKFVLIQDCTLIKLNKESNIPEMYESGILNLFCKLFSDTFRFNGKICESKEKTAVENAAEIRKEFEDFKGYIIDKLAKSKLESRSGIYDCKRAIAEMHGLIEGQDKKIKALEEKIGNLASYAERDFLELDKRTTKIENTLELMHRSDNSEKAIYIKYIDNEGRMYYKCNKCHKIMEIVNNGHSLFCSKCGIATLI